MRQNKVKRKLRDDQQVIGSFVVSDSRANIEVLAAAGYEFVVIDTEHFMKNPETIEHMVTTCEAVGITPFVRVQEDPSLISRALDCGAMGIIAPHVDTPEEARRVVDEAKYLPTGKRGACNPRAVTYGVNGIQSMVDFYRESNEETMVICQIETKTAVDNVEEIIQVEGIDSLFVGPVDLSNALGITGQFDHPKLKEQIDIVLETGLKNDMPVSTIAFDSQSANEFIEQGFQLIALAADSILLMRSAAEELSQVDVG
ncbi:MAG: HpcH/HpaI aldolase family protein [Candidatus Bipolaricaulota bacterium]